jgi:hypothetical protein
MRLVGYVRVSRTNGREGDDFISAELQRRQVEQFAASRGYEVVAWYTDVDESGGKASRPQFDRAMQAVESGVAQGIAGRQARSVHALNSSRPRGRRPPAGGKWTAAHRLGADRHRDADGAVRAGHAARRRGDGAHEDRRGLGRRDRQRARDRGSTSLGASRPGTRRGRTSGSRPTSPSGRPCGRCSAAALAEPLGPSSQSL